MKDSFSQHELYSLRISALLRDHPEVGIAWGAASASQLKFAAELGAAGLDPFEVSELLADCYQHVQHEAIRRRVDA